MDVAMIYRLEPNENITPNTQNVTVPCDVPYGDLPEYVDFDYVARVGRINLASMWSRAQARGWQRRELHWLKSNEIGTAGYEVVWRPTDAPLWTYVVSVCSVNTVTLPLSNENVVFGVRAAAGTNGYKSPSTSSVPIS
ncbi:hypothetical protein H2203_008595 [Taxawa tesnikishii (nom. ined.)]|nr:hypothetical protein H2203_008595 [Dothideales sp. JES 119]